jgi:hypothetical protein
MDIATAPIIDFAAYRQRRTAAKRGGLTNAAAAVSVPLMPVFWVPVMLVPFWIATEPLGSALSTPPQEA